MQYENLKTALLNDNIFITVTAVKRIYRNGVFSFYAYVDVETKDRKQYFFDTIDLIKTFGFHSNRIGNMIISRVVGMDNYFNIANNVYTHLYSLCGLKPQSIEKRNYEVKYLY